MMWHILATILVPLVGIGATTQPVPRHAVFQPAPTAAPVFTLIESDQQGPRRRVGDSVGVAITASSSIALDAATGAVLYEKNADGTRTLASITKLMTLLTIMDKLPDDSTLVTIEDNDYERIGHNTFVVGDAVTVHDLLAAAVIASDNTAVRALVRAAGFSTPDVVRAMNERAQSLGLVHASFTEGTGLAESNVATARDVARFATAAFAVPRIARFAGMRTYQLTSPAGKSYVLKNTNKLIGSIIRVLAGKTGFVDEAGYNLVSLVSLNGHEVLIVSLGSATTADRFQDVKAVATWVGENYTWSQ